MTVIPAMDIIDGCCVRLSMGDYASKRVYGENPVDMAKMIENSGLKRLHLVDLDGAKAGHVVNHKVLADIADQTSLILDVGGGLKSEQDFATVFSSGAAMATVGSLAATNRVLTLELLNTYGSERLLLGADCKDGMIAVSGWLETTALPLEEFIRSYLREGFTTVISTDIARDGMLSGPATQLYAQLIATMKAEALSLNLIASGGIRGLDDLDELYGTGLSGAIVGKALYEGAVTAQELFNWQRSKETQYVG